MPEKWWDAVSFCEGCDVEMIIEFSWDTGKMSVDPDLLILDMPMTNFRKWVKLFVKFGEPADHEAFLHLLEDQIQANEQVIKDLEAEVSEFQAKAERRVMTTLSVKYCREQARLKQRHLNGAKTKLKRRLSMRDQLKGLMS